MTKKWTIYVNRKLSGVGWGFDTFAKAVQYGRDQRAAEIARHGTDKDFWVSFIDGPGGRMDYETVLPLFQ